MTSLELDLPEETLIIKDMVRKFVERELIPLEESLKDRKNSYDLPDRIKSDLENKVKNIGLWAMDAPEEIGGAGLNLLDHCVVIEEAFKATVGRCLWSSLFFPVLYKLGNDKQKEKYLNPSVNGFFHGAAAYSEPNAAGDLAGIQTSADQVKGGWIINGNKCWISHALTAKFFLVLTRVKGTKRHDGITWFIIDRETKGFSVGREQGMIHGQPTYELSLNECFVSNDQLLGKPNQGWVAGEEALFRGRLLVSARAIGIAQRCFDMMVKYSTERVTFNKPLSSRQAIQWMIADSATEIHASRLMLYHSAVKAQKKNKIHSELAMLKLFTSEMAGRVVDRAVQIHGAMGLSDETILERCYRDVRPMRIYEGSSEAMRSLVAKNIIKNV